MWVRRIGSIARQQLQRVQTARVIGLSSAGIFIQLDPAVDAEPVAPWVVFLARQETPGPLTLNLPGEAAFFRKIQPGDDLTASPDELVFSRLDGILDLRRAEIWQAPPANRSSGVVVSPAARRSRLADVVRQAAAIRPASGWSVLLPVLADDPTSMPGLGDRPGRPGLPGLATQLLPAIRDMQIALQKKDGFGLAEALGRLAGSGSGLTPSGDDLALGLLLASSRWGELLLDGLDRAELAARVVRRAWQATTSLSASLIACAAQGQADPRLIAALDGLVTGQPGAAECAAGLASWGSSSGLDALLGMSLVI
jgi:hypothetical protein